MDVNVLRPGALLFLLLASGVGHAQTTTVGDLDRIQSETLKLKAEAVREKARAEIAELRNAGHSQAPTDNSGGLPVAKGVFGANGSRYVAFVYPNGGSAEAAAGGSIPGGYVVRSFDTAGVVLVKGGRVTRIPFSMHAPTPPPAPAAVQPQAFGVPMSGPVNSVPPLR